jgi:hypothetical protein
MQCKDFRFFPWRLGVGFGVAVGLAAVCMAQAVVSDSAAQNERASELDPEDYKFMQPVCTRCHDTSMVLHSRTWSQWQDVFHQMSRYGAMATQEQWGHILKYVGRNLTLIDVNRADEDELSAVLEVDEKTAIAMVQRRSDRKFKSVADLESVPGVNKALIEAMEPRLIFELVSEDP